MSDFYIPDSTDKLLDAAGNKGSTLPGNIPTFYWVNGDRKLKNEPNLYHGCWAVDGDSLDSIVDTYGVPYPPLSAGTRISANNDELNVYTSRHLFVAPIVSLDMWQVKTDNTTRFFKEYAADRRGVHWNLCMLGFKVQDGSYQSWGAAVLKVGGFQVKNLKGAYGQWSDYTAKARNEFTKELKAAGKWNKTFAIPSTWFWTPLGTFGDEYTAKMVGPEGRQRPITPISTYLAPGMTVDILKRLYVGGETLERAAEVLDECQEWLHQFDRVSQEGSGSPFSPPVADDYDAALEPSLF